jgi:hypothetical protein
MITPLNSLVVFVISGKWFISSRITAIDSHESPLA